ncbi:hypothetical protein ACFWPU_00620 [Streptomyces sp. NPDC058471]|uniref:hypothetical protein n=1 Tax=Streptomyces sp. NPDC058471 TaxID=3346516 RepID=UPI00366014AF
MYILTFILAILAGVAFAWLVANPLGWFISYRRDGYPFGWRVWLGPERYYDWAYERENA